MPRKVEPIAWMRAEPGEPEVRGERRAPSRESQVAAKSRVDNYSCLAVTLLPNLPNEGEQCDSKLLAVVSILYLASISSINSS